MDGSGELFGPLLEALPPWLRGVLVSYPHHAGQVWRHRASGGRRDREAPAGRRHRRVVVDARALLASCPVPLVVVEARQDRLVPSGLGEVVKGCAAAPVHHAVVEGPHLLLQCRARQVVEALRPVMQGWARGF